MEDVTFGPDQCGVDDVLRAFAAYGAGRGRLLRRGRLGHPARRSPRSSSGPTASSPSSGSRPAWPPTSAPRPTRSPPSSACRSSRCGPTKATTRHTSATVRTGASTARTSCSPASTTRSCAAHRLDAVAYGENADDARRPDRPGSRAATEHQVLRPLADAGLDKAAVRRVARVLELPCADKPAAPCLASRIPHFEEVSPEKLAQVEAAEAGLRSLGFADCRVRHHGDVARHRAAARRTSRGPPSPACASEVEAVVRSAGLPLRRGRPRRHPVRRVHPAPRGGGPWLTRARLGAGRGAARHRRARPRPGGPPRLPRGGLLRGQDRRAGRRHRRGGRGPRGAHPLHPGRRRRTSRRSSPPCPDAAHDATARLLAWPPEPPEPTGGGVLVVAAGTSDLPVAREALLVARHLGRSADLVVDVGVAGLHRILSRLDQLRAARAIVVVAGMDGALPGVVAGLVVRAGHRRADVGGLRRRLRGPGAPAHHAQQLRPGRRRGQHRQRLRRRPHGGPDRRSRAGLSPRRG